MSRENIIRELEAIYADYFDGLYSKLELTYMLNKLHKQVEVELNDWTEMLLDSQ